MQGSIGLYDCKPQTPKVPRGSNYPNKNEVIRRFEVPKPIPSDVF